MKNPPDLLPKIRQLTTPFGIYQFGKNDKPDPSFGYALDDQARALIVANELNEENLKKIYLQYILNSQRPDGLLYQFMDKNGKFIDNSSREETKTALDAYGQTIWALAKTKAYQEKKFNSLFTNLVEYVKNWQYLRPLAYSLLGLSQIPRYSDLTEEFTSKLQEEFKKNATEEWQWFENKLSYGNAVLPWALWEVFLIKKDKKIKDIAKKTTDFLLKTCQVNGIVAPIGSRGWYEKGGVKALFDQQPIDVGYMICCLEKAYEATKENFYLEWIKKWWGWFWGKNIHNLPLVDENLGCFDGLTSTGVNPNKGAESNICFIMAALVALQLKIWKLDNKN